MTSISLPRKLRSRRRLIGSVMAATFLLWAMSCSGAVVGAPGLMHSAGHSQHSGEHPDQCCNQLAKLASVNPAIVKIAPVILHLAAILPPVLAAPTLVSVHSVLSWLIPRAPPPRKRALIAHLSWPNAPPV